MVSQNNHQNTSLKASEFEPQKQAVHWLYTHGGARGPARLCTLPCAVLCLGFHPKLLK